MSKKISKRYKKILDSSKDQNIINIDNAIKKVKINCNTKFDESIDLALNLNLKQKKEEVNIRTIVNLPHGNGKKVKVAVLCEDGKVDEAKKSGAEIFGSENLINDITAGKINFDKLIATPSMMPKMGKLGTVTNDIDKAVKALKGGQIEIKSDKDGNLAASIGKKSFPDNKIIENLNTFVDVVQKEKPSGIKGDFVLSSFLTSTMGISYKIKLKI